MQQNLFHDIPSRYKSKKESIKDAFVQKLYDQFSYFYLSFDINDKYDIESSIDNENHDKSDKELFLFNYLKEFSFITYNIIQKQSNKDSSKKDLNTNLQQDIVDSIICVEKQCLIIEKINFTIINTMMSNLKKHGISIFNVNENSNEEILSICQQIKKEILNNDFVSISINSITGYLIYRYFYPTHYFKDPSFFIFDAKNQSNDQIIQSKIPFFLQTKSDEDFQLASEKFRNEIKEEKLNNHKNFKKDDFIILKTFPSNNNNFSIHMVIHRDSLYVLFMKLLISNDSIIEPDDHEPYFCSKYSHRCFTRFYGFVKRNDKIIGFIYEYLCNSSLQTFISSGKKKKKKSEMALLMIMNRIIQGIEYLHSNSLIHRDLKPSNILFDHDFVPFISDFETIRHPDEKNSETITNNIGSYIYSSPEQNRGENVSYPTDIYSIGMIFYFIFEQREIQDQNNSIKMNNGSEIIHNIYEKCSQHNAKDRPKIGNVKDCLINEINSFGFVDHLENEEEEINIKTLGFINFAFESIIINQNSQFGRLFSYLFLNIKKANNFNIDNNFIKMISYFTLGFCSSQGFGIEQNYLKSVEYYESSSKIGYSRAFNNLGKLYEKGLGVEQNYSKAKECYELSIKLNNSDALILLGNLYENGFGVEQSYSKSKELSELAAKQNNSDGLVNLGNLYYLGLGVKQSYSKAKKYYELAAKQNNSDSFVMLGKLYENGMGVKQSYSKAKKYYELAAEQNNLNAIYCLGSFYENCFDDEPNYQKAKEYYEVASKFNYLNAINSLGELYENGYGVEQDFNKARELYELAAKQNDVDGFLGLGELYENGNGVEQDYKKAKEYFELAAKQNNSTALNYLGEFYYHGYGVEQDYKKAKEYFELSSKLNNSDALNNLGNIYYIGNGVKIDYLKAKDYFEQALQIEENNSDAYFNLGKLYYHGDGVEQDFKTAIDYFESAADENNTSALVYLGNAYLYGNGVEQDYLRAKEFYEMAIEDNNSDAFLNLGNLYFFGKGVQKNYEKAREYYELAAKQNDSLALNNLGCIYEKGIGVKQDYSKAKEYYELSSKQNNPTALNHLGNLYEKEKNYEKAKEYYEKASNLDYSDGFILLGLIYENGKGVEQNYLKAKELYEQSIKRNNLDGFYNLANLYYNGLGVEQDYSKAKELYEITSKSSDSNSLNQLGNIYYYGNGVKQDYLKAKEYYELSSKQNNSTALNNLGNMYFNGDGVKQDYSKAKEYYELASSLNNADALNNLGDFYYYGYGDNRDFDKAKKYYELSAKLNNSTAFNNLGIMYLNGYGVERDYLRSKYYFELSIKLNNSDALILLGDLYEKGLGVEQNYEKARECYEMSSKQNNSNAFNHLGYLYCNGYGVERNYEKAKEYYEISSKLNNSAALLNLGNFYYRGYGVEKNCIKAKEYYELAAQLNNSKALFYLGCLYSDGDFFDVDIEKAIENFERCSQILYENIKVLNYLENSYSISTIYNVYCYRASNDLGLIHLFVYKNIEKATDLIKVAAFNEFPFGQNNFGLLCEFYLSQIGNADYMYEKSSKNHFALAAFNLGRLKEKANKIEESIQFFIKSSKDVNEPLMYKETQHFDKRLETSKIFIVCLADLKVCEYYFSLSNYKKSKKYFIKAINIIQFKFENLSCQFLFEYNKKKTNNIFSYIQSFVFSSPLFNFKNQSSLSIIIDFLNSNFEKQKVVNAEINNSPELGEIDPKKLPINKSENDQIITINDENVIFNNPEKLFNFIIEKNELKISFIQEIKNLIQNMEKVLYIEPYNILFGRLNVYNQKPKLKENDQREIIDNNFYDGFENE